MKLLRTLKLSSTTILVVLQHVNAAILSHGTSCQFQRAHHLLAALHATNKCVKDCTTWGKWRRQASYTIKLSNKKQTDKRFWYIYRNILAGFMHTHFCTINLVSTMMTGTDSISWIRTCWPQNFCNITKLYWAHSLTTAGRMSFCFLFSTLVVTIGFSGTYSVHEDAGAISIVVLVLMNSLARDVVVTFSTVDDSAKGRFDA